MYSVHHSDSHEAIGKKGANIIFDDAIFVESYHNYC